ncbi:MAG TPA: PQQ-dependent sugar dehydrogenase [Terriglobia bacterium]|nr:PQQ-dependent sugar dehydrogenase [Terriglobia bacterium]
MSISIRCTVMLAAAVFLVGCGGNSGPGSNSGDNFVPPPPLGLADFVSGLNAPVGFEVPDDGSDRIFIVEQGGRIRIIQGGMLLPAPFLDLTSKVESGGEKGLLGLAFHPNFTGARRFYVNYTRRLGTGQLQSVIAEYAVSATDANQADASSERPLLVIDQPFDNHNGGQLAFGVDGFLYIGLGDGGSGGDPFGNGQNKNVLLGKILRIGVDPPFTSGKPYALPADNPFASGGGAPEVWAFGLRNPWRFSFDHSAGRLFAADVGQDNWEEVDLIKPGGNYGWNIMEGTHCYPPDVSSCDRTGLILPIAEYGHDAAGGTAIIGGFVYHGSQIAGLEGTYVFGDLSSGHIWGLKQDSTGAWRSTLVLTHNLTVSGFGQDAAGELYLLDYGNGAVLRLRRAA